MRSFRSLWRGAWRNTRRSRAKQAAINISDGMCADSGETYLAYFLRN